jgi:Fur family ferric uptake transcriptional regulator
VKRRTSQREAIRQALVDAGRPLSPLELLQAAKRASPRLGLATVYRNLRHMIDADVVRAVVLPGMADRYEITVPRHHHHFHCRACDRVYEVEGCPGDLRSLAPRGFRVEAHELTLHGLCATCR